MIGRWRLKYAVIFAAGCLIWIMFAVGCATLSPREDALGNDGTTDPKPIEGAAAQQEPVVRPKSEDHPPKAKRAKDLPADVLYSEREMAPTDLAVPRLLHPASKLSEIDFLREDERISFYIFSDGRMSEFNASYLIDPPRLVVDLIGLQSSEVRRPLSLDGPCVKKVRVGSHPDKVRVVFDLITGDKEAPYQINPIQRGLEVLFFISDSR
jgi:hypothetical protein